MRIASKPMSSPGRTEKFPPPLMRFLKSNVGSKSRGRSRSSPMFIRKKNNNAVIEAQQEPSSPKVTCIGQVRSKKSGSRSGRRSDKSRAPARRPCSCWIVKKPLFCHRLGKKLRPRSLKPVWRKWVWFFRFGYCGKSEIREDSLKMECNPEDKYQENCTGEADEEEDEGIGTEANVESMEALSSSCPPKNALLLTRCRSAPYRSSSLANRFWAISEMEDDNGGNRARQYQQLEDAELEGPTSENEPDSEKSTSDLKENQDNTERSLGDSKENEGSIRRKSEEIPAHPVILTRCKSEPAGTGERLLSPPEGNCWREGRLVFAEPCSPNLVVS